MPSLPTPAPLAAEASHRPHTRARWAACAALMAAVLASACGGGGDDDNTPAPTPTPSPSPAPAPAPIATIDGYVGEWVSETCQTFGDGSTRDVLRITRSSGDQMDVRLLDASYPGANCTGERALGDAVPGAPSAERITLSATESSGGLSFNRGDGTPLDAQMALVPTKTTLRSVWSAPQADRLCALDDNAYDAASFQTPPTYYATAADVQAAYTQHRASACYTRLASDAPGAAQPLPASEDGQRFLNTLYFYQLLPSLNSSCKARADGGSERGMWRYVAPVSPFRLQPEWGKAVYSGSASCEGSGVFTADGATAARRLYPGQTAYGAVANPYRVQTPNSYGSHFGLWRIHGLMYRATASWPCDTGAREMFGNASTQHRPGPLLRPWTITEADRGDNGCSAITPAI